MFDSAQHDSVWKRFWDNWITLIHETNIFFFYQLPTACHRALLPFCDLDSHGSAASRADGYCYQSGAFA